MATPVTNDERFVVDVSTDLIRRSLVSGAMLGPDVRVARGIPSDAIVTGAGLDPSGDFVEVYFRSPSGRPVAEGAHPLRYGIHLEKVAPAALDGAKA